MESSSQHTQSGERTSRTRGQSDPASAEVESDMVRCRQDLHDAVEALADKIELKARTRYARAVSTQSEALVADDTDGFGLEDAVTASESEAVRARRELHAAAQTLATIADRDARIGRAAPSPHTDTDASALVPVHPRKREIVRHVLLGTDTPKGARAKSGKKR